MIRNRWAALAAMMCSLAAQGFALAQQTNTPDAPSLIDPATNGAIVTEAPAGDPAAGGQIIIRTPDGKTRLIKMPTDGKAVLTGEGLTLFEVTDTQGNGDEGQKPESRRYISGTEAPFTLKNAVTLNTELPKFVIGVSLSEVPASLRAHLTLPEGAGIMVGAIVPDSPAAKAGLQQYDVLLKSGDRELKVAKDLQEIVDASEGKTVSVALQRKGQPLTLDLTPVKREDLKFPQTGEFNLPVTGTGAFLMRSGDDPVKWLELMQSHSGVPQAMMIPGGAMMGVPGPQLESLTDSLQKLTDQIERLQKAVDRLEQRQGGETPDVPAEEKKVDENGGALRLPRANLTSFISLS